jgi:hypothetical protein
MGGVQIGGQGRVSNGLDAVDFTIRISYGGHKKQADQTITDRAPLVDIPRALATI